MKTKRWNAILLALCGATAGRATLEFSGYFQAGKNSKFIITDVEEKKSSAWLSIGGSFEGFSVAAFDSQHETLSVRKDGITIELPLKPSHTKDGSLPPEIARRGITPGDLVIREDANVRVVLGLGVQEKPVRKRFVSVQIRTAQENVGRDIDETSPTQMTRETLPSRAQSVLSDSDIENINRHLAIVLPKWLPDEQPNHSPEPAPSAVH